MTTDASDSVRRRRHGPALEAALLAAAWDELAEAGYARLTMESIAKRARTSEAVLYRRWPNKEALVRAALQHRRQATPIEYPDTGALRTDLIAELTVVSEALAGFYAIAAAAVYSGLMTDTGLSLAQGREQIMGEAQAPRQRPIYRRAHQRGELDPDRIPVAVLDLPFDLVRHDLLMDLKAPSAERIRSIVDDLFLPLVRP